MSENNFERIVIEDYKSDFLYKKNKSNLNITYNRIAFIFFVFLIVCSIYSIRVVFGRPKCLKKKILPIL